MFIIYCKLNSISYANKSINYNEKLYIFAVSSNFYSTFYIVCQINFNQFLHFCVFIINNLLHLSPNSKYFSPLILF